MTRYFLLAVASVSLTGCMTYGDTAETAPAAEAQNFTCDRSDSVRIAFAGDKAMLTAGGTTATLMRSCREEKWAMSQPQIQPPAPPTELAGTKWQLVHFQSSDDAIGTKVPPAVERYVLEFMPDGNAALQLDCNRARSMWKAEPSSPTGGELTMAPGPMTRAACQPGAMDTQIARDLTNIRSYTFRGEFLGLALQADAGIYLWKIIR